MVKDFGTIFRAGERPTGIVSGSGIHLRPVLDEVLMELPFAEVEGVAAATMALSFSGAAADFPSYSRRGAFISMKDTVTTP